MDFIHLPHSFRVCFRSGFVDLSDRASVYADYLLHSKRVGNSELSAMVQVGKMAMTKLEDDADKLETAVKTTLVSSVVFTSSPPVLSVVFTSFSLISSVVSHVPTRFECIFPG